MIKNGGDFVLQELPLFVQEYLTWGIIESSIYFVVGLALLYFGISSIRYFVGEYKLDRDERTFEQKDNSYNHLEIYNMTIRGTMNLVSSVVGTGFGVLMTILNLMTLLQILFTPRVYLIKNLLELI